MNVFNDVEAGVQTILLLEDSIRYTSIYLSFLYKMIFTQSLEVTKEGLNEHQKLMRMRGRPKVLLAKTYEEAFHWYQQFKSSMLGIISDVRFKHDKNSLGKTEGGIELCRVVRNENPQMPIILQSSDGSFEQIAGEHQVGFVNKTDKELLKKLEDYITEYFCFGSFIFRDPESGEEIARADDLFTLQTTLASIPDRSLNYHVSRDHFSKWLNARGLFSLGELFRSKSKEDFSSTREIRQYLMRGIDTYRSRLGQGIIAQYNPDKVNKYTRFSRIGKRSIGGKARGLAFADSLIKKNKLNEKYPGISVQIPITVAIGTDLFDEFMENNHLYPIALSEIKDEEILAHFLQATLPAGLEMNLKDLGSIMGRPVAIRSSSLLEDSYYEPFAGIYATYMIPCRENTDVNYKALSDGVKAVYASVFYKNSKSYMKATSNVIEDEKMGIVLQEICGQTYGDFYYPVISGVVKSINYYPIGTEKPSDGVACLAFGLGKYIVEGGSGFQFSPAYPKKALSFYDPKISVQNSQKYFYALDLKKDFVPGAHEDLNLQKNPVKEAETHGSLRYVASTWDYESHTLKEGILSEGKRIITFSHILQYESFPLAEVLRELLTIGAKELGNPVEIEFAMDFNPRSSHQAVFELLQIRPILHSDHYTSVHPEEIKADEALLLSRKALGNGVIGDLCDVVYIKPASFDSLKTREIAESVDFLNRDLLNKKRNYILIGPGRWGSSDPALGIPVQWSQISGARVIVETSIGNFNIEPSQGTHFFQNLTAFRVGYFSIDSGKNGEFCNLDFLDHQPAVHETEFLRHIRFPEPLLVKIDGEQGIGVVMISQGENQKSV